MDPSRFDSLSRFFAERRLSRREAVIKGGTAVAATGLAAAGLADVTAAQDATPEVSGDGSSPPMLFVQTFQAGSIAPKDGAEGRYTLNLESGVGQTIYFSDRPDRIVGATATPGFLEALGFPDDNPPNAALVVENAAGETDVAVIELFSPVYDEATKGLTYEIEVLENWAADLELGLHKEPTDLSAIEPSFGSAHLFIDGILDCPDHDMICFTGPSLNLGTEVGVIPNADHDGYCVHGATFFCYPCKAPEAGGSWAAECNRRFSECGGDCSYYPTCTSLLPSETGCAGGQ